jgi:hypothetical protein
MCAMFLRILPLLHKTEIVLWYGDRLTLGRSCVHVYWMRSASFGNKFQDMQFTALSHRLDEENVDVLEFRNK